MEKYNLEYELVLNENGELIKILQKNSIAFDKILMKDFIFQLINQTNNLENIIEDFTESKEFIFDLNNIIK